MTNRKKSAKRDKDKTTGAERNREQRWRPRIKEQGSVRLRSETKKEKQEVQETEEDPSQEE